MRGGLPCLLAIVGASNECHWDLQYSISAISFSKMKVVFTTLCALLLGAAVANKPVPDDAALEAAADREHEQRKVKVYFDSLDENGDGFLTADEAEDKIAGVVRMLLEVDLDSPTLKPYKDKAR